MKDKLFSKHRWWRGWTALISSITVMALVAGNVALQNQALINLYLGTPAYKIVEGKGNEDTEYVKSSYGEKSETTMNELIADTYEQVINEEEEGAVLLKNENNALPLNVSSENRVTLFGRASADPLFTCSGSQSFLVSKTPEECTDLYEALNGAGFVINDTLYNAYKESPTKHSIPSRGQGTFEIGEENISFYTDSLKASWSNDYNDVAIVVLSRYGGEGIDIPTQMEDDDGSMISGLSLIKRERDMLQMIKDSGKFSKTIVLLNTPYQMEVEWLDEYDVDACLWIGCTGATGFTGVANILSGVTNPSGKLPDTYAASSLSSPAIVNSCDNTATYTNVDEVLEYTGSADTAATVYNGYTSYIVQLENIYFGYKYYETRYEDCILNQGNADSVVGSTNGNAWNYAEEMSYPFGYGLSYTTFTQTLDSVEFDEKEDIYRVTVTVKNTGDVEGKSAVQLYAQTPYGDYEKENGVEKSAIQLIDFGKTGLLKPGEEETITMETDGYLLASYDDNKAKGYILSAGEYYLAIGDDSHDALNNILAAKGANGLYDQDGKSVEGDSEKTWSFTKDKLDAETYRTSDNGTVVTNQFDDCDINYWDTTKVTYLSRQDWEGTFPTEIPEIECTEDMLKVLNNELYTKPEDSPSVEDFTQGVDNGLTFVMMKDVEYDDPLWEDYLDQFTLEELAANATDNFGIPENANVSKPATAIGDGTNGYRGTFSYGDGRYSCQYASSGILAATFNKDLMKNRAKLFAEESLYSSSAFEASEGAPIAFGTNIGANLHRTPFGGRQGEYLSEDANLTAIAGEIMSVEMTSRGYAGGPKHFVGNDQETGRGGLSMFFTEQAFREGSLRGFEGCLGWGDSMYTMQSMGRIGLYYIPGSKALNTQVLENEWGFKGFVMTDGALAQFGHEFLSQLEAGTDNVCLACRLDFDETTGVSMPGHQYIAAIEAGDGYILQCLRQMVKDIHYTLSRTMAVNGLDADTQMVPVTPWWKTAMYGAQIALAGISVILLGMTVASDVYGKRKSLRGEE